MEKSIIIATIKDSEKWFNITDNTGVEYGIYKEKAPKLTEQMKNAKAGDTIIGNASTKDNKNFLWDLDEKKGSGGGKSYAPKDKSFDAAIASIDAAAKLFSLSKDVPVTKVTEYAEAFHAWIMSKSAK